MAVLSKTSADTFTKRVLYYLLLGVMQALWTNPSTFPPLPFRVAMIVAVFGPALFRKELVLFAVPFSLTLRGFLSTGYSFLPDVWSYWFYIGILLIAVVIHRKQLNFSLYGRVKPLIIMLLLFAMVDLVANGEVGKYATHIFIGLLLILFINKESDFHQISAAIIAVSLLLSVYYIVMFDRFLESWGSSGLERSGWADPNYFSTTLDRGFFVAMIYLVGFCKSDYSFFNKRLLAACCIIIASAVLMTASRAGFLCIAFVLIIALFTAKLKFWHFLLALLVIAAAGAYMYNKGVMDVLLYRLFEQGNLDTGGDRTTIWQLMLRNFWNQDFVNQLFGGGYWHRVELTQGMDLHNEFFSIMADYGLIGLLLFVCLFFSMASFRRGEFWKQNIAVFFYFFSVISLSPFQSVFILFLIVWIYALKFENDGLLIPDTSERYE